MELTRNNGKLLKVTGAVLSAAGLFGGLPIKWRKEGASIGIQSSAYIRYCQIRLACALAWYACSAAQIWYAWDHSSYVVKSFGVANLAALVTCVPSALVCVTQYQDISDLLASFVLFEQRQRNALTLEHVSSSYFFRSIIKLFGILAYCAALVSPLEALNSFMNPCIPVFVGYWTIPQCTGVIGFLRRDNWRLRDLMLRFLVSCGYFMALNTIGQPGFLMPCQGVLQGFCIPSYVEACTVCLKRGRYNSACSMYREVQILLVKFREVYFKRAMVGFFVGVLLIQVTVTFGSYEMYRSGQASNALSFFVPMVAIVVLIMVWVFGIVGILGTVYTAGKRFEAVARRHKRGAKGPWLKKFLASCPTTKIQLAGKYYIDPITAVNMEDFAWQATINLMLM